MTYLSHFSFLHTLSQACNLPLQEADQLCSVPQLHLRPLLNYLPLPGDIHEHVADFDAQPAELGEEYLVAGEGQAGEGLLQAGDR